MSGSTSTMVDLLVVLVFVVYSVSSGLRSRRLASRGLDEYFLAGRSLRGWQAGASMAATQFAADTPLLVTGLVATAGVFALWRLWIYGLAFLLLAFVFAGMWRRAGVLTDAELTELRYSGRGVLALRTLKAVYFGTLINCVVLAMVLVAAVRIAEVFLPWHEWLPSGVFAVLHGGIAASGLNLSSGASTLDPTVATTDNLISIVLIVAFAASYSMTGGLRSVVATDVAQLALALGGTAVYAAAVAREAGGLTAIPARLAEIYGAEPAARLLSWHPPSDALLGPFLVVVSLQWLFQMNSDGTGYLAQRAMACRTTSEAGKAGVVFAWLQIVVRSLLWLVIALGLLVLYPFVPADVAADGFAARRELTFVLGIQDLLVPGARGLMLVALLAALASTIDTHLNWGASYWANDVYKRLVCEHILGRVAGSRELVVVARLSNLLILIFAFAVMANLGSIQEAWFVSLLFGAGMGSVLVLRWLWERINLWSELAAMATSLLAAPVLLSATSNEWIRLGVMAALSSSAAVAAALLAPETERGTLARFYERVQPMGWWPRTAAAAGADPAEPLARLARASVTTALTAASMFLVLVGMGRFIVPPPQAANAVSLVMLASGLALVPAWMRYLR